MRIGDLAGTVGVPAKTVRYYEQGGLMPAPPRAPGGYRDYAPEAATRLAFIRDAQHAGLTLAEIRGVLALRDSGQAPCAHVTDLIHQHLEEIDRRIAELRTTRIALRGLARRAAETDPSTCAEDGICTIFPRAGAREGHGGPQEIQATGRRGGAVVRNRAVPPSVTACAA